MHETDASRARAELVMFVDGLRADYVDRLRELAHWPHLHCTWLGVGWTLRLGRPLVPNS